MSEAAGPGGPADFGRVEADGTVYVRTPDGERSVGQVPDATPEEAMSFFVRRYQGLEAEVNLFAARLDAGSVGPDEARKKVSSLRTSIAEANAVGDLQALLTRLDEIEPKIAQASEAKKAERAQQAEQTKAAKETMVAEAEKLAAGNDWRGGVNRFRALLEEWKALPRIDRATDDELWHRFSSARTTYTRRRKAQFAQQNEKFGAAKQLKEQIITEAEGLAGSTEWGPTAGAFRDLMARWKAAGSASRSDDDKLWARFRGLQDQFFEARNAAQSEQDAEFKVNQDAKEALLDQAEKDILPVSDVKVARSKFRDFLAEYNQHGKVPRDAIRPLDNRVRKIENAIKDAEDAEWKRTDPEARQRAADTVAMFETQIAKLQTQAQQARATGKDRDAAKAEESISTYQTWLDQAKATLADFER